MGDARGPGEPAGEWYEVEASWDGLGWTSSVFRYETAERAGRIAAEFRDYTGKPTRVVRVVRAEVVEEFAPGGEGEAR